MYWQPPYPGVLHPAFMQPAQLPALVQPAVAPLSQPNLVQQPAQPAVMRPPDQPELRRSGRNRGTPDRLGVHTYDEDQPLRGEGDVIQPWWPGFPRTQN